MLPVLFINCDSAPFVLDILRQRKLYETRDNRNTVGALVGSRVLLAETGRGHRPVIRGAATISDVLQVFSRSDWQNIRSACCIRRGSRYDWQPGTRCKYLYKLDDVRPCSPFTAPEGARHGRVWMEYAGPVPAGLID